MKRRPSPRATADAYEKGVGFKVAHKRCDQCLFSDAKIVSDERRDELLKDCTNQGTYFICHKATARGDAVVCRGFFDLGSNQACRMAEQLSIVVHVDASTGGAQVKEQLCLLPPDPPAPLDRGLLAYCRQHGIPAVLPDTIEAGDAWGANCGPMALAAVLDLPTVEVACPLVQPFRGFMSPTDMYCALDRAGAV